MTKRDFHAELCKVVDKYRIENHISYGESERVAAELISDPVRKRKLLTKSEFLEGIKKRRRSSWFLFKRKGVRL